MRPDRHITISLCATALAATSMQPHAAAGDWSAQVGLEWRGFPQSALDSRQHDSNLSLSVQPEYHARWANGRQSFDFVGFARWDQHDDERTHGDIRELAWVRAAEHWELRLGVRKVFWGVTESVHLVDIINQTDLVENIDGEDKLGQPMINLAWIGEYGTLDFFLLTGFRERTFPGVDGRLRAIPPVDTSEARYESDRERAHVDWALRWSKTLGDWDVGIAHFAGTNREPTLQPGLDGSGNPVLIPFYPQIRQTSLDLQATKGQWLWKLEALYRRSDQERFRAAAGGFEYTFVGVFDRRFDVGLLAEYLYDSRGDKAATPFEDDVFLGSRIAFNDVASSEILIGVIDDRETAARLYNLEASRRLGANWKLIVEARAFSGMTPSDRLYSFRRDDYVQLEIVYYF